MSIFKKCPICGSNTLSLYKKFVQADIYECKKCSICLTKWGEKKIPKKQVETLGYLFSDYKKRIPFYAHRLDFFISKLKSMPRGKLLDIGSGYGLFSLLVLKETNFEVTSIEPYLNEELLRVKSPQLEKLRITYEKFLDTNNTFYDVIVFLDVLEHFPNISSILSMTYQRTSDNGYIFVQLPNYKSLMSRICINWAWWMPDDHYFHFTPKSITKMLRMHGYKVISLKTTESLAEFKKNLDGNFEGLPKYYKKLLKGIMYIPFFFFYLITRPIFHSLGMGGLIQLTAQKI